MNDFQSQQPVQGLSRPRRRVGFRVRPTDVVWAACLGLCAAILFIYGWHLRSASVFKSGVQGDAEACTSASIPPYRTAGVLVSYAFYEKDAMQRSNMEFFLQHGWVAAPGRQPLITWVFVVTGDKCTPCTEAFPITEPLAMDPLLGITRAQRVVRSVEDPDEPSTNLETSSRPRGVVAGRGGGREPGPSPGSTLVLWRGENVGMDLAAHNTSLEYLRRHTGGLSHYRYFFLLNSSVKGPFLPAYLPTWWHWSHAFLERFMPLPKDDPRWKRQPVLQVLPDGTFYGNVGRRPTGPAVVRAVGSSLVCLPEADAGGPGPRLESWAVALDEVALEIIIRRGVLKVRSCKTCLDEEDGIIVGGEYGITAALLEAGYNVATLMSKYARDVDWRDQRHWGCNDMVHPSRHGTYDGIGFHPYETVFVKSSWHVADPYTRRYGLWMTQHKEGDAGTDGEWNEKMYQYAISTEAQMPNLLEVAYDVVKVQTSMSQARQAELQAMEEEQRAAGERAMSDNI